MKNRKEKEEPDYENAYLEYIKNAPYPEELDKETVKYLMNRELESNAVSNPNILEMAGARTAIAFYVDYLFSKEKGNRRMLKINEKQSFGPYIVQLETKNHAVIYREDDKPVQPNWYEIQFMKNIAFAALPNAIEIFPPTKQIIDGENQRHLWRVDQNKIPNIYQKNEMEG